MKEGLHLALIFYFMHLRSEFRIITGLLSEPRGVLFMVLLS